MDSSLEDRIRERAYCLWANSGGAGDNHYFWLMAEREVLAEIELETLPALPAKHSEPAATQAEVASVAPTDAIEQATVTASIEETSAAPAIEETATTVAAAEAAAPLTVEAPVAAPAKPKKAPARRKSRKSTKKSSSRKAAATPTVLTVVEGSPETTATIMQLRPVAKTSAKLAAPKARARAAAR